MKVDYIALSIPVFFILIGIELAYNFYKKLKYYRFNDSISNLSQGIGSVSYTHLDVYKRQFKGKLANHCWRLWHDPVITWDGLVAPCCFDKDAQHQLGDLKKKPFKEIWKNGEYSKFRQQILKGRKNIDICSNCSEGTRVWES